MADETIRGVPVREVLDDYRAMCVSRALDDREIAMRAQSRVFFQISGAGHEALLLGLARSLRPAYDWFFPYYRDRALMLGLGVPAKEILLQAVGSADDPSSGGRQMPCHWGFKDFNVVTQTSATGSQCLAAIGCAEGSRYLSRRRIRGTYAHGDEITYVSLGEGSTSQGEFWESLNTATRLHLPVLYVVEDNGWAISVRADDQHPAPISDLVQGFRGLHVLRVNGWDYFASRGTGAEAVEHVRAGTGPCLLHATVTRPYSHSLSDDQTKYRTEDDLRIEQEHDPIDSLEWALVEHGVISADQAAEIRGSAKDEVAEVAAECLAAPRPDPATAGDHVLALPDIPDPSPSAAVAATSAAPTGDEDVDLDEVSMSDAIRRTLREQMARDERIRVFGEDVADAPENMLEHVTGKGGVFGVTHGLQREFGTARCFNTPLAEANIIGRGIGMAVRGLKPCAEIQFFDYIWTAMQQIKTEGATVRWRSNGRFACPLVIRVASGGYLTGGAIWHSQCGEAFFAHIPGMIVLFPSRARDAVGLLRAAFRCDDPVLFMEHKHLYRQVYAKDPWPGEEWVVPIGRGDMVREGTDATIVTWGATVRKSWEAARRAEKDGISVEIIDLRSILPWDREMVCESVAKTGRLVVVHEDTLTAGFGGEISSWVAEHCFWDLDAPVVRVTATDTHVAYEPGLEEAILPQVDDILSAVRSTVSA